MKGSGAEYEKEYKELLGEVAQATNQIQDPVAIGLMLYQLAEERKSTNLIIKNLNSQIEALGAKIEGMAQQQGRKNQETADLTDRDIEVLEHVREKGRICADELQKKLGYKGKNAASARLSKLFHEGRLEKEYAGRRVYYRIR